MDDLHQRIVVRSLGLAFVLGVVACEPTGSSPVPYTLDVPAHFPELVVPEDNPLTQAGVELGRYLFHDFRLSGNGERSCGICHEPAKGFTDGFVRAVGATGESHTLNTLSLVNVGYRGSLGWRSPEETRLDEQWHIPMFGDDPIEMGITEDELVHRLETIERYPPMFEAAFPDSREGSPISIQNVGRALASFQRTIIGGNADYDRFTQGDDTAMSESAVQGMIIFTGLGCDECHGGTFFDEPTPDLEARYGDHGYANTGQYNLANGSGYPPEETGLSAGTNTPEDNGRFRIPTLRAVGQTGPWSHDGTTLFLADLIDDYARGGRNVETGPYAGDGADNPNKNQRITGFDLSETEQGQLLDFLGALTDHSLLERPELQTPFCLIAADVILNEPCERVESVLTSD